MTNLNLFTQIVLVTEEKEVRGVFYPNKESKDYCCAGGGFALAAIIPIVGAATGAGLGFSPVSPPRSANGSFL